MEDAAAPLKLDPPIQLWIEQLRKNAVVWLTASFVFVLIGWASAVGSQFVATVWAHDTLGWEASDTGYPFKYFLLALLPVSVGGAIYNWVSLNYHRMAQRCLLSKDFAAEQVYEKPRKPWDLLILGALYYLPHGLADAISAQLGLNFRLSMILWVVIGPLFAFSLPLIALKGLRWREAILGSIEIVRRAPLNAYATVWGCALLAIGGMLGCGIGLLFTMPVYFIGVNRLCLIMVDKATK